VSVTTINLSQGDYVYITKESDIETYNGEIQLVSSTDPNFCKSGFMAFAINDAEDMRLMLQ
jgi:hypothetical protein